MIDIVRFKDTPFDLGYANVVHYKQLRVREGGTLDQNRTYLNDRSLDILFNCEYAASKDHLHYRHSGLNHVALKLAKKHNIAIGFSFSDLLHTKRERALIFGRIQQNVRFCRKLKVPMVLASFAKTKWDMRNPHDLMSLGKLLGMTAAEAKKAVNFTQKEKGVQLVRS